MPRESSSSRGAGPGEPVRVLALDGSPTGGGRTEEVIRAVLSGLPADVDGELVGLADGPDRALAELESADAFIFGSPLYRASFAAPLKLLLDQLPRGMWGESSAPITARAVAVVGTGATWHHFLGLDPLRNVLSGFFAAHVLPPGVYVPSEGFTRDGVLLDSFAGLAAEQGRALVELAAAIANGPALRGLKPQA